ncbi:hypothetical protein AFFFEF_00939 [Methylorubrum extorquens]
MAWGGLSIGMPRLTTLAPRLGTLNATYLLFMRSFMRQNSQEEYT